MPQITGIGTTWNLPNYAGELFTADPTQTPLLSMIGGLTGGRQTFDDVFPTAVLFDYPAPAQRDISEQASVTAPAATAIARTQESNVVQIHQEVIDITYKKQSNSGKLSGLNSANATANPPDEKAWQIQQRLVKIARDVEHSFISGAFQKSTAVDVANKTRGMMEVASGASSIDANGARLSKDLLKALYLQMANNGALFGNMVLFCNAELKQQITGLYETQIGYNQPAARTIGGMSITTLETDFFSMGVVWNRFMPKNALLIADVAHIAPVFQAVPDKGVLFEEPLAKIGASDRIQVYGQIGLAHGPSFLHGSMQNLDVD